MCGGSKWLPLSPGEGGGEGDQTVPQRSRATIENDRLLGWPGRYTSRCRRHRRSGPPVAARPGRITSVPPKAGVGLSSWHDCNPDAGFATGLPRPMIRGCPSHQNCRPESPFGDTTLVSGTCGTRPLESRASYATRLRFSSPKLRHCIGHFTTHKLHLRQSQSATMPDFLKEWGAMPSGQTFSQALHSVHS